MTKRTRAHIFGKSQSSEIGGVRRHNIIPEPEWRAALLWDGVDGGIFIGPAPFSTLCPALIQPEIPSGLHMHLALAFDDEVALAREHAKIDARMGVARATTMPGAISVRARITV